MILLSPAKTLNESVEKLEISSQPALKSQRDTILKELAKKSPDNLQALFKVSEKLATLNHDRFKASVAKKAADIPAIQLFKGDVYQGLNVSDWNDANFVEAQNHIRILSGLYGILRPLDLVNPYRLEMGTKLPIDGHKNLYEFWGDQITEQLNKDLAETKADHVINLASNEYFKAIKTSKLSKPLLNIQFKEWRGEKLKVISFSAKKARGIMARFLVHSKDYSVENIKSFGEDNYVFDADRSDDSNFLFVR